MLVLGHGLGTERPERDERTRPLSRGTAGIFKTE